MKSSLVAFIVIIACTGLTNHTEINESSKAKSETSWTSNTEHQNFDNKEAKLRSKRGIFWDFFQKMVITKNLIVDQYTDTRDTLDEVYNLLNDQFSDPAPEKPRRLTTSTESTHSNSDETTDSSAETTTEAFRISRYELGRILGRNFRGLKRLQDIEFQDALNQSHYNIQEYKAEAKKQFANSLAVEKKKHFNLLKG